MTDNSRETPAAKPKKELTAAELQALADEWSTEYVEFTLTRNEIRSEVLRKFLLDARYETSAGKSISWPTPPGFETVEAAAIRAKAIAEKHEGRRPKLRFWQGN